MTRILTVSELTFLIKRRLEEDFIEIWVEGEVSNVKSPASGHLYLTLKDERSQVRAVIFRSLGKNLKFQPGDGQQVLCRGHLGVYEPRGEYQLVVDYIEPRGMGALQAAFDQLKEKLRAEGLFEASRKRSIPLLPGKIGLITSLSGAVLHDILQILDRRYPNLSILISPVSVQGETAAGEIVRAIEDFNSRGGLDVMIIARGGGSLEDLWAFNEEPVARAIAASRIPVISAVGHETDYTIADFVSDLRAPTPSAAAELVVRPKEELGMRILSLRDRVRHFLRARLEVLHSRRREAARALMDPRKRLEGLSMRLDELRWRAGQAMARLLREKRGSVREEQGRLLGQRPDLRLQNWATRLAHLRGEMIKRIIRVVERKRAWLANASGRLDSLSPLAVLSRGYSIARILPDRRVLRDASRVKPGDRLLLRLHRGELVCEVGEDQIPEA